MIDQLQDFLLAEPKRMVALGRGLIRSGGFLLLCGVIGHTATTAMGVAQGMAKQSTPEPILANLYPGLPTWWVPESIAGCFPALLMIAIGLPLVLQGKQLLKASR